MMLKRLATAAKAIQSINWLFSAVQKRNNKDNELSNLKKSFAFLYSGLQRTQIVGKDERFAAQLKRQHLLTESLVETLDD